MHHLRKSLSGFFQYVQLELFPRVEESCGPLTEKQLQLLSTLEMIKLEYFIPRYYRCVGRPKRDRIQIARAFVAKAIYNITTTSALIDRLKCDKSLRQICGWETQRSIPSESKFSRSFSEFSKSELPQMIHASLIKETHCNRTIGHISRDSTKIESREKPLKKQEKPKRKKKRGRPKKGEQRAKKPRMIEQQLNMSLSDMVHRLPSACDVGTKKNSKGYKESWVGYKLHIDCADGQIPISCLLTSASVHDSQVAIPLATMSSKRVQSCYDLMDSAYDAPEIKQHSRSLGHIPIIDINPRRNKALKEELATEKKRQKLIHYNDATQTRYNERSSVERLNARLKDEFGGRHVRVRSHRKVACHLMFGILALTVDQLSKLVAD